MSIVQQAETLKDVSDKRIQQEMQQPTGQFPLYLVTSEAKRRADLRQRFKAEKAEAPQTTVQEELMAKLAQQTQTPGLPQGAGAQGLGSVQPPQQHPQQAPPRIPPQAAPSLPPSQNPRGFAQGGMVRGYAGGGNIRTQNTPAASFQHGLQNQFSFFGPRGPNIIERGEGQPISGSGQVSGIMSAFQQQSPLVYRLLGDQIQAQLTASPEFGAQPPLAASAPPIARQVTAAPTGFRPGFQSEFSHFRGEDPKNKAAQGGMVRGFQGGDIITPKNENWFWSPYDPFFKHPTTALTPPDVGKNRSFMERYGELPSKLSALFDAPRSKPQTQQQVDKLPGSRDATNAPSNDTPYLTVPYSSPWPVGLDEFSNPIDVDGQGFYAGTSDYKERTAAVAPDDLEYIDPRPVPEILDTDSFESLHKSRADELAQERGDPYAKFADIMAARAESVGDDATKNKWMALAEAGFAIAAGESQYAMTNIGKGAGVGVKALKESNAAIQARKDKNLALNMQLSAAQQSHKSEMDRLATAHANGEISTQQYNAGLALKRNEAENTRIRILNQNRAAKRSSEFEQYKLNVAREEKALDRQELELNRQSAERIADIGASVKAKKTALIAWSAALKKADADRDPTTGLYDAESLNMIRANYIDAGGSQLFLPSLMELLEGPDRVTAGARMGIELPKGADGAYQYGGKPYRPAKPQ